MEETKRVVINKNTAVLEKDEKGGYTVYVPALPGCISEKDTLKEAITNIRGR
jgi:predicted RNase H-like HicB family nuclease